MAAVKSKHKIIAGVEAELLKRLRARGGMSRVELARELNLAPSTAGIYVDRLIREKFLQESAKVDRDFGRPPILLAPNPDGGRFVGVDFQPRNISATAVDFSQKPLKNTQVPVRVSDSLEQIFTKIEQAIDEVVVDDYRPVLGIGVGLPGVIDPVNGVALHYSRITGWKNIPFGARLSAKFKVPVFLENNIRSMALAELWFGQGCGISNFVCLGVRTGIAAGIVIGGQLHRGRDNFAGEIGNWSCPTMLAHKPGKSPISLSWQAGQTLESLASTPGIVSAAEQALQAGVKTRIKLEKGGLRFEDVARAYLDGDELATQIIGQAAFALAWSAVQIRQLLNPDKIILAGPLTTLGDAFLDTIKQTARQLSTEPVTDLPLVVYSNLGEYNGALGAAALALHQWKPAR